MGGKRRLLAAAVTVKCSAEVKGGYYLKFTYGSGWLLIEVKMRDRKNCRASFGTFLGCGIWQSTGVLLDPV